MIADDDDRLDAAPPLGHASAILNGFTLKVETLNGGKTHSRFLLHPEDGDSFSRSARLTVSLLILL